jgi:predicted small metal-binding protein
MPKFLHCSDAGFNCDAVIKAETTEDLLDQVRVHAERDHSLTMTPDVQTKVRGLVRDE